MSLDEFSGGMLGYQPSISSKGQLADWEKEYKEECDAMKDRIMQVRKAMNASLVPLDRRTIVVSSDIGGEGGMIFGFSVLVNRNYPADTITFHQGADQYRIDKDSSDKWTAIKMG